MRAAYKLGDFFTTGVFSASCSAGYAAYRQFDDFLSGIEGQLEKDGIHVVRTSEPEDGPGVGGAHVVQPLESEGWVVKFESLIGDMYAALVPYWSDSEKVCYALRFYCVDRFPGGARRIDLGVLQMRYGKDWMFSGNPINEPDGSVTPGSVNKVIRLALEQMLISCSRMLEEI